MGNIVSKVPLKDGTIRYLADSEARTRVTTLEALLDGHSVQANVPQDAVFTDTVTQYSTLPAPSAEYAGQIYQYTGIMKILTMVKTLSPLQQHYQILG